MSCVNDACSVPVNVVILFSLNKKTLELDSVNAEKPNILYPNWIMRQRACGYWPHTTSGTNIANTGRGSTQDLVVEVVWKTSGNRLGYNSAAKVVCVYYLSHIYQ